MLINERSVIVASCISGDGHFSIDRWRGLRQLGFDVGEAFLPLFAATTCGQDELIAFDLEIHGWVKKREELMTWLEPWKTWLLTFLALFAASEEISHGLVDTKVDLCQKLAINLA